MATHSCILAWRIPGTGEPGGLSSMGSHSQTRLTWLSSSSSSTAREKRSPANSFWSSTPHSGVGCHSFLHRIFPMRDWTSISYGSLPLAPPGKLELGSRGLYWSWMHRGLTSTFLDSLIISSHESLLLSRALWKSRIWGLSLQDSYKPIPVPFTVSEKL